MAPTSNNKLPQPPTQASNNLKQSTKASEKHDISVIAESLDMSHKNVAQIAFVLENGSDDVKNLLVNECNIIYECRVCVSMFRSFGNFVAHKRLYCKGHECERMVLYDPSWFKSKNGENVEVIHQEKNVDINDSIQPEITNSTNQIESQSLNSDQTNQAKSPTEVSNKKRKLNSVDSNVTSLLKPQINTENTNGIPESSFYSNEPSRSTISNTSTTSKDKEKHREPSDLKSKRLTRQCLKKATTTSLRPQDGSKFNVTSSINGTSIVNGSHTKPSLTRSKLSTSIDSNGIEKSQKPKKTLEPLIIHRHFHHHHQPEPISLLSTASSTKVDKICTKKSKQCSKITKQKEKPIEVIEVDSDG